MMVSLNVLSKYNENNLYSRNQLLKVKNLITPQIIDQIPILYELKNYLERLSMVNSRTESNFSSVRVVTHANLHDEIARDIENWEFDLQFLDIDVKCPEYKGLMDSLMEMYMDQMELSQKKLVKDKLGKGEVNKEEKSICAKCKKEASKRCSECKKYFYCSKNCQKKDLKSNHKNECKVHYEYVQKCIELLKKKKREKLANKKKGKVETVNEKEENTKEQKLIKKTEKIKEKVVNDDIQNKDSKNVFSEMKSAILLGRKDYKNVYEKLNQLNKPKKSIIRNTQKVTTEVDMDELD